MKAKLLKAHCHYATICFLVPAKLYSHSPPGKCSWLRVTICCVASEMLFLFLFTSTLTSAIRIVREDESGRLFPATPVEGLQVAPALGDRESAGWPQPVGIELCKMSVPASPLSDGSSCTQGTTASYPSVAQGQIGSHGRIGNLHRAGRVSGVTGVSSGCCAAPFTRSDRRFRMRCRSFFIHRSRVPFQVQAGAVPARSVSRAGSHLAAPSTARPSPAASDYVLRVLKAGENVFQTLC